MDHRSRRFAERLFAAHPEWRELARVDPDESPPGSLLVEVQSPVAGQVLMVRTYGDQITIDFGPRGWHEHFGPLNAGNEDEVFDRALAFIDDLIADRVVIITRMFFGWSAWSRAIRVTEFRPPKLGTVNAHWWSGKTLRLWTDCRPIKE